METIMTPHKSSVLSLRLQPLKKVGFTASTFFELPNKFKTSKRNIWFLNNWKQKKNNNNILQSFPQLLFYEHDLEG